MAPDNNFNEKKEGEKMKLIYVASLWCLEQEESQWTIQV